jgi:hypothetical protein
MNKLTNVLLVFLLVGILVSNYPMTARADGDDWVVKSLTTICSTVQVFSDTQAYTIVLGDEVKTIRIVEINDVDAAQYRIVSMWLLTECQIEGLIELNSNWYQLDPMNNNGNMVAVGDWEFDAQYEFQDDIWTLTDEGCVVTLTGSSMLWDGCLGASPIMWQVEGGFNDNPYIYSIRAATNH